MSASQGPVGREAGPAAGTRHALAVAAILAAARQSTCDCRRVFVALYARPFVAPAVLKPIEPRLQADFVPGRVGFGRTLRVLTFTALLSALPGVARVTAAAPTLEPAEYEVLSLVINHGLPADTRAIAISAQTTGDPGALVPADADLEVLAKRLDTAPGLLAGWAGLNQQRSRLARKLTLRARYELVSEALRAKIFEGEDPALGWARFHARFPEAAGLLGVSRVAIDEARLNALVYIEFACGPECGTGRLVRLARVDGVWQVQSGELLWVAGS